VKPRGAGRVAPKSAPSTQPEGRVFMPMTGRRHGARPLTETACTNSSFPRSRAAPIGKVLLADRTISSATCSAYNRRPDRRWRRAATGIAS